MTAPDPYGRSGAVQADLARIDAALAAGRVTDEDPAAGALQALALALRDAAPRPPRAFLDALDQRVRAQFRRATSAAVLTLPVRTQEDALVARRRARDLAALLQLTPAQQIGLSTALSEVIRLSGGEHEVELAVVDAPPSVAVRATVSGLAPSVLAAGGDAPLDLAALRPLVDRVEAHECDDAAVVRLSAAADSDAFVPGADELELVLASLTRDDIARGGPGLLEELRQQNFELLTTLATLRDREQELARLSAELRDANRAISALYAELEAHTAGLRGTVIRLSDVDVSQLFAMLRAIVIPLDPGFAMEFEDAHDVGVLRTDAFKLSLVLRDLILNAVRCTEAGFVHVSARTVDDGEAVRFEVGDTWPGLSAENRRRGHEHFAQIGAEPATHIPGPGLDVPLARRLAALLGGDVALLATGGGGARYSVTVPARYPEAIDAVNDEDDD